MRTVAWQEGAVHLIDQRQLPFELTYVDCADCDAVVAGEAAGSKAAKAAALGVPILDEGGLRALLPNAE